MDNFLILTAGYVRGFLLKLFLSLSLSKKEKKATACFYKTYLTNSLYGRNYYHFYGKTNKQSLSDVFLIDLVTVFDAILTSRQTREKLQCLYENLMSDNFRKKAVLKKISIVN